MKLEVRSSLTLHVSGARSKSWMKLGPSCMQGNGILLPCTQEGPNHIQLLERAVSGHVYAAARIAPKPSQFLVSGKGDMNFVSY